MSRAALYLLADMARVRRYRRKGAAADVAFYESECLRWASKLIAGEVVA